MKTVKIRKTLLLRNNALMANYFNKHFINLPTELQNTLDYATDEMWKKHMQNVEYPTMHLRDFDGSSVYNIISSLKNFNSTGVDGISANLINLINLCFSSAVFPDILKAAKVVPLQKSGDQTLGENLPCCPLSRKLYHNIHSFLYQFDILHPNQHGFSHGKSTTSVISVFINELNNKLNYNRSPVGLLMDLTKAFDLVDHQRLLQKLERYGLRGHINE